MHPPQHDVGRLDVDFVIGGELAALTAPPAATVYIVPCFKAEKTTLEEGESWPMDKDSLVAWHSKGWVSAYGEMKGWPLGHVDADYETWYRATEPCERAVYAICTLRSAYAKSPR